MLTQFYFYFNKLSLNAFENVKTLYLSKALEQNKGYLSVKDS